MCGVGEKGVGARSGTAWRLHGWLGVGEETAAATTARAWRSASVRLAKGWPWVRRAAAMVARLARSCGWLRNAIRLSDEFMECSFVGFGGLSAQKMAATMEARGPTARQDGGFSCGRSALWAGRPSRWSVFMHAPGHGRTGRLQDPHSPVRAALFHPASALAPTFRPRPARFHGPPDAI